MSDNDSTTSLRLISWTLAGAGTAPIIGEAIESVAPLVNEWVAIRTSDDPDVWDSVCRVDESLRSPARSPKWPWRDHYGDARNAALEFVERIGATWSLMIDTDERAVVPDPAALRAWLAALPPRVVVALVHAADGSHTRERFFRHPCSTRFVGRTHEMFPVTEEQQAIVPRELATWTELPKTREQLRAKFERDVKMLHADADERPSDGALLYYLGTSLQSLAVMAREDGREADAQRDFACALAAYREHRRIDTASGRAWHEGTAWSCYRAAECYLALGENDRVLDCVAAGLVLDAGIAELYWIAGVASLRAGRPEQARAWAAAAKVHGLGSESERRRRGFRIPRGLTTGPDEVIAAAQSVMSATHLGFNGKAHAGTIGPCDTCRPIREAMLAEEREKA